MIITIYSNCQGHALKIILEKIFKKIKVNYISNYEYIYNKKNIDYSMINDSDYFIYQPIKKERGKYSTDYILSKIDNKVITVSFPYIYNTGMWAIVINNNNLSNGFNNNYTDFNLNSKIFGKEYISNFEKDIEKIFKGGINFNLKNRFFESLNKLTKIEENTDIKISDFIRNNYKNIQMFYRDCHPSLELMKEVFSRLMIFLEIPFERNHLIKINDLNDFNMLTNGYIPITKIERKELELIFEINDFFKVENENYKNYFKKIFSIY